MSSTQEVAKPPLLAIAGGSADDKDVSKTVRAAA